ncbi:quinoprotein [Roseivivax halodurans JCM 10272]|uniref:Quinoprotein n=1 Tax=Roseivivax halodurans JCM 10272 TaxID=1449350 RepID=X7EKS0_9RHOB|nr:PQQ-like beta-propeller repeat protein [Roseivivax halodurans]ETX16502.1 quinoprotein [Roseivivax halodurans JCM 10272]
MRKLMTLAALTGATLLGACGEREVILPGERLGVREVLQGSPVDAGTPANRALSAALPGPVVNGAWPQSPVSPHVRTDHAALSLPLALAWATDIGQGDVKRQRLNVNPVTDGARVYTMSSDFVLSAVSARTGQVIWSRTLTPSRDQSYQAQGGGLALGGGALFVASGFGGLYAIDPETGGENWRQNLDAGATGAPSYRDGMVYVTSGDSIGWALRATDGRVRWTTENAENIGGVAGAPAPALGSERVVFGFGDATLRTAFREGGYALWSENLAGGRRGRVLSKIDDLTGDPVIAGDTVYAGNHSGRFAAFSLATGERRWEAQDGALERPAVVGNSVYFVSDINQLVRLDRETGARVWAQELPGWRPSARPSRRRDSSVANHGPVVAGGLLWVASSDGALRGFAPEDGRLAAQVAVPGGATTQPIVAGGTLYLVSADGTLIAYR